MRLPTRVETQAVLAAAAPTLLAYNVSPSPTFYNQVLAIALWGGFVAVATPRAGGPRGGAAALVGALALTAASVLWSWLGATLPAGLALSALGLLLAAAVLVAGGAGAQADAAGADAAFAAFCTGWAVAGACNVGIALAQVFVPDLPDGDWLAASGFPGRAVGNLRQPNHLSSVLAWSAVAVVGLLELRRLPRRAAAALFAAIVFGVVLTASRTGLVSILLLALWGALDRRLSKPARALLLAAPLVYAVAWGGMAEWAKLSQHPFGGEERLAESDISSSRFAIWRNTLAMIGQQPWRGVGFGEFNFAWSLTPFPHRPVAFFDHSHNLPLQLVVEIGLPLAAAVLALLAWALWRAARQAFAAGAGPATLGRRCTLMMVLLIGLHSLLEYPLWYAYFLLPAAWAWAFAAGPGAPAPAVGATPARAAPPWAAAGGAALIVASVLAVFDYRPVAAIFAADEGAAPLAQRIERGRRSLLFAHHADYAAATTGIEGASLAPFGRATHYLLDTRLMIAWAKALAANGQTDAARFVAARLREFRNPDADEFFGACGAAAAAVAASAPTASAGPPFQCEPPQRQPDWRAFATPALGGAAPP